MRNSKLLDVYNLILDSWDPGTKTRGVTTREIPPKMRRSFFRYVKRLIAKGLVIKTIEPIDGTRGRPAVRYRVPTYDEAPPGLHLSIRIPVRKTGDLLEAGRWKRRYGKRFVQRLPEAAKERLKPKLTVGDLFKPQKPFKSREERLCSYKKPLESSSFSGEATCRKSSILQKWQNAVMKAHLHAI